MLVTLFEDVMWDYVCNNTMVPLNMKLNELKLL